MKSMALFLALVLALGKLPGTAGQSAGTAPAMPAHVSNSFEFEIHAPLSTAAKLFGPEGERCWAGRHWNPVFVYPQPGKDVEGAVFTVQHGPHTVVWVNTIFDLGAGRMQYVAVIPDAMTFTVDVRLSSVDASTTHVKVIYTRTALDPAVNQDVIAMGKSDRESGPDWQKAIEGYLRRGSGLPRAEASKD
jgi:hypothetical protein